MKVLANEAPKDIELLGKKKLVNFNIEQVTKENEDGTTYIMYQYEQLRFKPTDTPKYIENTVKDYRLNNLKVTTASGKTFYADPSSRVDLRDAIAQAEDKGLTSTTWKLAEDFEGSRYAVVTLDELKEASSLALEEKGKIVGAL